MRLSIKNYIFNVKVVRTPEDQEKGMMGQTFNSSFNGMLFLMKNPKSCFWMKNCIIPLDIIFIKNGYITKIYHDCQPCNNDECKDYCGDGSTILEVLGGTCKRLNIKIGNKISLNS